MMWMLFRNQGKVKVTKEIEWAGKAPLEVFAIDVTKDYKIYHFIIPKPCGNIALRNIEDAPPPLAVCSLVVTPEKANLNDPITIDMSGTQNAKSMVVEVLDAQGNKVATPEPDARFPEVADQVRQARRIHLQGDAPLNLADVVSDNPCQAKTYINFPPVCKLWTSCLPCEDYVGRPIAFDASGSTDPDGEIVKAVFEITDASGAVIDTFTKTDKPLPVGEDLPEGRPLCHQRHRLRQRRRGFARLGRLPPVLRGDPEAALLVARSRTAGRPRDLHDLRLPQGRRVLLAHARPVQPCRLRRRRFPDRREIPGSSCSWPTFWPTSMPAPSSSAPGSATAPRSRPPASPGWIG